MMKKANLELFEMLFEKFEEEVKEKSDFYENDYGQFDFKKSFANMHTLIEELWRLKDND